MKLCLDDSLLDALADEYHNGISNNKVHYQQIYTFEQFIEMKKKEVA